MNIGDILDGRWVRLDLEANSKKRVLEAVAEVGEEADPGMQRERVFEALLARERLGSTGLGHGVGLPHARLGGLARTVAVFLRLREPVDYDAPDGQPVTLVVGLLVPQEVAQEHLEVLSQLAETLSSEAVREALNRCASAQECIALLTHGSGSG